GRSSPPGHRPHCSTPRRATRGRRPPPSPTLRACARRSAASAGYRRGSALPRPRPPPALHRSSAPSPRPFRSCASSRPALRTARRTASFLRLVVFALPATHHRLRFPPVLAQPADDRLTVAVRHPDAFCARCVDRCEQRRPVDVVGEDEAAIHAATPACATDLHPSRRER